MQCQGEQLLKYKLCMQFVMYGDTGHAETVTGHKTPVHLYLNLSQCVRVSHLPRCLHP